MDQNQERVELFKAYSVEEIEERRELFSYWPPDSGIFDSWSC